MVALWMPNAASESLETKKFVSICLGSSWPRTPGPATAFPNLILLQNEPPMVALWLPNAASESLEKKLVHSGPSVPCEPEHRHRPYHKKKRSLCPFVSVILAPNTWSRHSFSQSNSAPKRASHGRTLAA